MKRLLIILSCTFLLSSENWVIKNYVNEFSDYTDTQYIANKSSFNGSFSNYATNYSDLTVDFIIEEKRVNLKLYEYAGFNPVKDKNNDYKVSVSYDGKINYFKANIYNGKLKFKTRDSKKLIEIFKKNSNVKFFIKNNYYSKYRFEVNTNGFNNVYNEYIKNNTTRFWDTDSGFTLVLLLISFGWTIFI